MVKPRSHLQTTTFSDMFLFCLFFYYSQTMTFSNLYFFLFTFYFFSFLGFSCFDSLRSHFFHK
uniref:Truncated beta C1 protein n=1 Tax=Cotton leaf curl Multan betasatellite TaxID=306025 RepID=M1XJC1_9VIRU|nr:truncated beta C1 protein [Cotton leaf curl Multan betasatellite]